MSEGAFYVIEEGGAGGVPKSALQGWNIEVERGGNQALLTALQVEVSVRTFQSIFDLFIC